MNAFFHIEERNKYLDIILFTYYRGVQKYLFYCSRLKNTQVIGICLRHMEAIVHDQSPSQISPLYAVKKVIKGKTYPVIDSPIHGTHDGGKSNSVVHSVFCFFCLLFFFFFVNYFSRRF